MTSVNLGGKKLSLNPTAAIGKGGEADVFDIGGGLALKLFKPPNHPDFVGMPIEQKNAADRIAQHQKKLKAFPKNLPGEVVTPMGLATDSKGMVVGYSMRFLRGLEVLLRYTDRKFRDAGIPSNDIPQIFTSLHGIVSGLHAKQVVIGDFNDLNVLVEGTKTWIIDADSFQFGGYQARMFTAKFVDPMLCDPKGSSPMLVKAHNENSDWYAYCIMLMQCLLFVDPYGGVYRPKDPANKMPHGARPLHRVSVFNPEVKYPRPAIPFEVLSDEILEHFIRTFTKDERGVFPLSYIENLRWTTCVDCGREHLRQRCPWCVASPATTVTQSTTVRGTVTATRIFQTDGIILHATVQDGKLRYLVHHNGEYRREDGSHVVTAALDPQVRYRIQGKNTLMGKMGSVLQFDGTGRKPETISVDTIGTLPVFDANRDHVYWLSEGSLVKDGKWGTSDYIGDVMWKQTLFWIGPKFGFGFYRAGQICVAFTFDATTRGIRDTIKIPQIRGQLLDATALFADDKCWFFYTAKDGSKTYNHCVLINQEGGVLATAEAEDGDGSWLGVLRGKFPVAHFLFAATDEGLKRIDYAGGAIAITRDYPDTEQFIDSGSRLFVDSNGLHVVGRQEITRLVMR